MQSEAPAQPIEAPEEGEPSPTPQEAPAQPPEEAVAQRLVHHEGSFPSPSQNKAQLSNWSLVVTLTPKITNEVEISPTQQEALAQPSHLELNVTEDSKLEANFDHSGRPNSTSKAT